MEGETELEMVRRHVREGEHQVKRQGEIVVELQDRGSPTEMAITLLEQFKDLQREHIAHMVRLEGRNSTRVHKSRFPAQT